MLLEQSAIGLGIAVITSWLSVRLALSRFKNERRWERKLIAYEKLLGSIHKSQAFAREHLSAYEADKEVSKERDMELRKLAAIAREDISYSIELGSLTFANSTVKLLKEYLEKSDDTVGIETWQDYLDHELKVTTAYLKKLAVEAKLDLKK